MLAMPTTLTTGPSMGDGSRPEEDPGMDLRVCILRAGSKDSKTSQDSCKSQLTRDTMLGSPPPTATPGRTRKVEPPPPIPRRSDFGDYYPDGGWGWVVCGASFVVHFLSHGFHLAFGTLLSEMNKFDTSTNSTVWIGSSGYGVALLLCPLAVAVCRRKSTRLCAVVGGLISSLGCLFLSFSVEFHQLFVSFTMVLSLGTAITFATASIITGRYFLKQRECAEMLTLSGSGVGMALISVFIHQLTGVINWMRSMQALTGLMLPTVVAGALYRSANLYHPRRRAILHIKNLRKTKKQQREFENKPPYFDWNPLRMRALQVLMLSTTMTAFGTYVPFVLLCEEARSVGILDTEVTLLMVFLGVAFACGCLLFGLLVIRSSLRCMIARQYLCQLSALGCGIATLMLYLARGFDAFAVYVWVYGLLCGGYHYSLKVYTYEMVSVKLSERSWGYISLAQSIPTIVGPPIAVYLNSCEDTPGRAGFIFAGSMMMLGSALLFLMPWAANHHTNHEVIQEAHFRTKTFEDDMMFYGMEISEDSSSKALNNYNYMFSTPLNGRKKGAGPGIMGQNKIKLYTNVKNNLGHITEEEHWSEIEAMSPMSPTDKVTEFLLQSQSMLQNLSHLQNLGLPGVRLEINNEYVDQENGNKSLAEVNGKGEIRDIKLEATICRNSPKRIRDRQRGVITERPESEDPSHAIYGGSDTNTLSCNGSNTSRGRISSTSSSMQKTTSV